MIAIARPARASRIAPAGWIARDGSPLSPADEARADRSACRRLAGMPADWPLPHGMIAIDVPDARRAILVRPAA